MEWPIEKEFSGTLILGMVLGFFLCRLADSVIFPFFEKIKNNLMRK